MDHDKKYFLITIGLLILCFAGFGFYHHWTIQQLRIDITNADTQLRADLITTTAQLKGDLFVLDQKLDLKAQALEQVDEQFHNRLVGASQDIKDVRKESQLGISAISEKSDQLESDLLSINIQTKDFTVIISRVIDSVVAVRTDKGVGSGAIVNKRGFIVTNAHVIEGAGSAAVVLYDKSVHAVQLVAKSENFDLALLKIGDSDDTFPRFKFANDKDLRVGEKVAAMGSPGGLDFTVTEGIISALSRSNNQGADFLQTDVSINPGNSGGPLVNIEGKIVGINTMKKQGFEGVGFAIKADQVKEFVEDAISAYDQALREAQEDQ